MLEPIIRGILIGLLVAILVGPVFFLIINTSIKRGFVPASRVALGVMLSDAIFIFIAYFGSTFLIYFNKYKSLSGIIAGLILIGYGCILAIRKSRIPAEAIQLSDKGSSWIVYLSKGFLLNGMNPSVLIFWIGVAGTVSVKEQYSNTHLIVFYSCTLLTIFSTDLAKAYVANKLKSIVTEKSLTRLNRICGASLILYGVYVLIKACMV